jgi:uncharacterized protein YjbJ (UPF0337 family)
MNKHQVEGRIDQAKGKVKEVTGRLVGNDRLAREGLADQAAGRAQAGYGDLKEDVKDKLRQSVDRL